MSKRGFSISKKIKFYDSCLIISAIGWILCAIIEMLFGEGGFLLYLNISLFIIFIIFYIFFHFGMIYHSWIRKQIGWVLVIFFIPFIGMLFYFAVLRISFKRGEIKYVNIKVIKYIKRIFDKKKVIIFLIILGCILIILLILTIWKVPYTDKENYIVQVPDGKRVWWHFETVNTNNCDNVSGCSCINKNLSVFGTCDNCRCMRYMEGINYRTETKEIEFTNYCSALERISYFVKIMNNITENKSNILQIIKIMINTESNNSINSSDVNNSTLVINNSEYNNSINDNITMLVYEYNTHCPLSGEVYFSDELIGKSEKGEMNLSKKYLHNLCNNEIKIKGLTDTCFDISDENISFFANIYSNDTRHGNASYYSNGTMIESITDCGRSNFVVYLNVKGTANCGIISQYTRPYEVERVISNLELNKDSSDLTNIKKIYESINWHYKVYNGGFRTPAEIMRGMYGTCVDWTIYTLSLMRAYNPNISCYGAEWTANHANVLCVIGNKFIIFDENSVTEIFTFDNKLSIHDNQINILSWERHYLKEYGGLSLNAQIGYLSNDKECFVFNNIQEGRFYDKESSFENWVLNKGLSFYNKSISS